jgi:hypothetical protein
MSVSEQPADDRELRDGDRPGPARRDRPDVISIDPRGIVIHEPGNEQAWLQSDLYVAPGDAL